MVRASPPKEPYEMNNISCSLTLGRTRWGGGGGGFNEIDQYYLICSFNSRTYGGGAAAAP